MLTLKSNKIPENIVEAIINVCTTMNEHMKQVTAGDEDDNTPDFILMRESESVIKWLTDNTKHYRPLNQ